MIDTNRSIALIQHNFPQVAVQTVLPITRGWDSFVLEVNGELIFRFPMREDVIEYLQKEMRLLPVLDQALSTPIPHFNCIGHGDENYPFMFVGYCKLGGLELDDVSITPEQLAALTPALEDFLNDEAIFAFQPVLIHCDLACEHIFCDPVHGVLTGVIDWGNATIGDPALDFVGLHHGH